MMSLWQTGSETTWVRLALGLGLGLGLRLGLGLGLGSALALGLRLGVSDDLAAVISVLDRAVELLVRARVKVGSGRGLG